MSRWHWGAVGPVLLAVMLVVSACGRSDAASVSPNEIVAADRGDIRVSVSATGNVTLPNQATLNFGSAGTVKKVAAAAGDRVTAGQVLAELDDTDLATAVANADASLTATKDALARLDATPLDLAKANQAVVAAQFQIQTAQTDLDKARAPYTDLDLKKQQQAVANARVQLETAQTALDNARNPTVYTQQDIKNQASAVANAKVQLQNAQNALDKAKAPYTDLDLKKQQEAIVTAQAQLQAAQDNLTKLTTPVYTSDDFSSAQAAIDRATETLRNNQDALMVAINQQTYLVKQALDNLAAKRTAYRQAMLLRYQIPIQRIPEAELILDPATLAAKYYFGEPQNAADPTPAWAADVVAQNASDSTVNQQNNSVTAARKAVTQAQDALRTAQMNLTNMQQAGPKDMDIALAKAKIDTAQASVAAAQDQLKTLQVSPDPLDIALKQAQITAAQATLAAAQQKLADMQAPPNPNDLNLKQAAVVTAQAALADAQQNLALMVPDPQTVAVKQAALETARASLADAQQTLALLKSGGDPVVRTQRLAAVKNAEQSLANAKDKVDRAHIKAPFDAAISTVSIKVGDTVGASTAAMVVVDPTQIEVNAIVDEVDVLRVRVGQTVLVGLQSAQGIEIPGKVKTVSLLAAKNQGIVSYPITVSITLPTRGSDGAGAGPAAGQAGADATPGPGRQGANRGATGAQGVPGGASGTTRGAAFAGAGELMRDGLSALLTIVIQDQPDAVRVPSRAISTSGRDRVVKVVKADGTIEERTVQAGLTDGSYTQIVSGIQEGEKVQLPARATSTTSRTGNVAGGAGGGLGGLGGGRQVIIPGGR